jgi:hypothetical protein
MKPTKIAKPLGPVKPSPPHRTTPKKPGGATVSGVPAGAKEKRVKVSYASAKNMLRGAFGEYFDGLRAKSALADHVAGAAKHGIGLSTGAATILSAKLFERMVDRKGDATPIGLGEADQLSLTLLRLRHGAQGSLLAEGRLLQIEQSLRLKEFDAVQAAIDHAQEIKDAVRDRSVNSAARMERVRKILFGERPADWTPITVDGDGHKEPDEATPGAGGVSPPIPPAADAPAESLDPAPKEPIPIRANPCACPEPVERDPW